MILSRLIEQTIAFLEGRGSVPYHLGPIEDETKRLVPQLVEINRLGLVTTCSQPGEPLSTGVWPDGSSHDGMQRSFLTGICTLTLADFLHDRINRTNMVCVVRPLALTDEFDRLERLGATDGERWIVTLLDGEPVTAVGHWIDELTHWGREITPRQYAEIAASCCAVAIMDPVWGRDALHTDGLLPAVLGALRSEGRPPG